MITFLFENGPDTQVFLGADSLLHQGKPPAELLLRTSVVDAVGTWDEADPKTYVLVDIKAVGYLQRTKWVLKSFVPDEESPVKGYKGVARYGMESAHTHQA